jgi:hypothetical protein
MTVTPEKASFQPAPSISMQLATSGGGGGDAYDPLAALMAPPPRSASYGVSLASMDTSNGPPSNADPSAALMAPPMRRVGASVPNFSSPPKQNVPNISMWKPPSSANSPATMTMSASAPSMSAGSSFYGQLDSAANPNPNPEATNQPSGSDVNTAEDFSTISLS